MTYALDTEGLQKLAQPILTESTLSSALILPGIRLLNLPDIIAVDQIQLLRDLPASGYALFAMENLNNNLQSIFNRTQGAIATTKTTTDQLNLLPEPVPYRQPFKTAVTRYRALQREWSFLWMNNQISIHRELLLEWGKQTDALSTALEQLATEPSMNNLLAAKAALSSFRGQFPKWMQQQAIRQPYQVQVWDYRLATIERLLGYGERMVLNSEH